MFVLNKLQAFHFCSYFVQQKNTSAVFIHSMCYGNHVTSTLMVIRIELRIFDQIVMWASFLAKKGNCCNFEDDCVSNGTTGKLAACGVLIYS